MAALHSLRNQRRRLEVARKEVGKNEHCVARIVRARIVKGIRDLLRTTRDLQRALEIQRAVVEPDQRRQGLQSPVMLAEPFGKLRGPSERILSSDIHAPGKPG